MALRSPGLFGAQDLSQIWGVRAAVFGRFKGSLVVWNLEAYLLKFVLAQKWLSALVLVPVMLAGHDGHPSAASGCQSTAALPTRSLLWL